MFSELESSEADTLAVEGCMQPHGLLQFFTESKVD